MNMFEDRMTEKATEVAKIAEAEERNKAEGVRLAHQVAEDLIKYIGNHPNLYGPTIEVGVEADRVTVRKKASDNRLEITVLSPTTFRLSDGTSIGREVNRSSMIDNIVDWMKRPA